MTPGAHKTVPAGGFNAKPMGARNSAEGALIQLRFASSQCLDNQYNQYSHNLQYVSFD